MTAGCCCVTNTRLRIHVKTPDSYALSVCTVHPPHPHHHRVQLPAVGRQERARRQETESESSRAAAGYCARSLLWLCAAALHRIHNISATMRHCAMHTPVAATQQQRHRSLQRSSRAAAEASEAVSPANKLSTSSGQSPSFVLVHLAIIEQLQDGQLHRGTDARHHGL